jgi:hypothetical protein
LQAEIQAAIVKWNATPLEEKIKIGHWHSTPEWRKEPSGDGPFSAWANGKPPR